MEAIEHAGQKIKFVLNEHKLTDKVITSKTKFEQSFLSKIYTSRVLQPRSVKNFIYVINKVFDLNIDAENILDKNAHRSLIY